MGYPLARPRPYFLEGPPDHGASAVHLVSVDRPQPAEIRALDLSSQGGGFREGNGTRLFHGGASVTHRAASYRSGEPMITPDFLRIMAAYNAEMNRRVYDAAE